MIMFTILGNAKSKTSKTPASSGAAKGSSPEVRLGSYFSNSIEGEGIVVHFVVWWFAITCIGWSVFGLRFLSFQQSSNVPFT